MVMMRCLDTPNGMSGCWQVWKLQFGLRLLHLDMPYHFGISVQIWVA